MVERAFIKKERYMYNYNIGSYIGKFECFICIMY